jgi:peptidoglycan-N-acetylglucosamine deacetylase
MAVTTPPRPAGPSTSGRSPHARGAPARPTRQLRVHWDRVGILAAILVLIIVLVVVLIVRAFAGGSEVDTAAVTNPTAAVEPSAVTEPAGATNATTGSSASPSSAPEPCRAPAAEPIFAAPAVAGGDPASRTVALTFDDGPGEFTQTVLDILREKQVRATFFVIGKNVVLKPEMVKAVVDAGHLVGNHTWSHTIPRSSIGWKSAFLSKEILRTGREIVDATGQEACVFRPPGGVIKGVKKVTRSEELSTIMWSVDTRDWSGQTPGKPKFADTIRRRALTGLKDEHPILLMHDGGGYRGSTVAALPGIIDAYRAAGYQFVDMSGRT